MDKDKNDGDKIISVNQMDGMNGRNEMDGMNGRNEIIRIDKNHIYSIEVNGERITPISVTTLIKKWFNTFNEDETIFRLMNSENPEYKDKTANQIKNEWKKMRDEGCLLHKQIEDFFLLEKSPVKLSIEFGYFLNFLNKHSNLKFYRSEMCICSRDHKVAGTIDCLFKDEEDRFYLIDWKRSKEIRPWSSEKGFGPFSNLNDCNYIHYTLQLNLYRYILETNYNISIYRMWLVNLHPRNSNYKRYSIEKYDIESIYSQLV